MASWEPPSHLTLKEKVLYVLRQRNVRDPIYTIVKDAMDCANESAETGGTEACSEQNVFEIAERERMRTAIYSGWEDILDG